MEHRSECAQAWPLLLIAVVRIALFPSWGGIFIIIATLHLPKIQRAEGCDAGGNGDMGDDPW
jgi:hypothetical protein